MKLAQNNVVVDGWNFAFALLASVMPRDQAEEAFIASTQKAEVERVLRILSETAPDTLFIAVFDSKINKNRKAHWFSPNFEKIICEKHESADHVIRRIVYEAKRKNLVAEVITSDSEIRSCMDCLDILSIGSPNLAFYWYEYREEIENNTIGWNELSEIIVNAELCWKERRAELDAQAVH